MDKWVRLGRLVGLMKLDGPSKLVKLDELSGLVRLDMPSELGWLFGQLRLDGLFGSFVSYKLVKLGGPIKLAIK